MHHRVEEGKIKQYVSKYQNPDSTRRGVMTVLNMYSGLSCKQEHFVFSNGVQKNLAQLVGTIPIQFKGSVYNIPICIWLMDTHPNNAPMCYVKPTADMQIKPSMFVDQSGKIYLPYLHEWSPNTSDLMGLIQVMVVTFGEQPPVYSKPRGNNAMSTPYPTTPFMPVPGGSGPGVGSTPYPVYPTSTPYPTSSSTTSYPPPYPAYPPSSGSSAGFPPYPPSYPSFPGSGYGGAQGYPYPPSHPQTTPQTQSPGQAGGATGTITEEHIRLSLLSAVEDKLRCRMTEQLSQTQAELETLHRTQRELTQGKERLDDILARVENEEMELDRNIIILKDKEQELEKAISRLSEQEPIDVDEAVTTTTPLYKQLLNAFAEEAAIEDTIYYMGEALRRGVIDLDVFLKQVRALSRKQFMFRALMHKCREKAGLAG